MNRIPVYFRPEMVADVSSFSPSAGKPWEVVADWTTAGLPIDVRSFEPLTGDDLALVHDSEFVSGILSGQYINGFRNRDPRVAIACLHTTGAMTAAAREAIRNRRVAVAPVSGFHHAGHSWCGGYCTFNGLMAAATLLRASGLAARVGILDLDQHYGNGTQDIIDTLGAGWVRHYTAGRFDFKPSAAEAFLGKLPELLARFSDCDVLLYQAGADPHVDDPLGGWMTTAQLMRRDQIVFREALGMGLPVAWNLAGGYQRDADGGIGPVLAIHRNTMRACADAYQFARQATVNEVP
jgi:acetoin utilization deacetylase AcuC-like enzyme